MLTLKITQDTFAKTSPAFSETLSSNQKQFISAGKELKFKSYIKKDNHYLVKLENLLGSLGQTVFFFEKHIQVEEIRAVWITNIDSDILKSKDNIREGLTKLKDSGFNTLYPVVWNKGFTFFQSSLIDNTPDSDEAKLRIVGLEKELAGRDILAEIIEVNQDLGNHFRVIAWFEYGLMLLPNSPLVAAKPEWLMLTNAVTDKRIFDGKYWLNPTHPEVQKFLTGLIGEVVENYEIDGIQLDDHFGIPRSMGFDAFTLGLFNKDNPGAADLLKNPNMEKFKTWRKEKVTESLRLIFNTVKKIKDDCIVSISPNPLDFSIQNILADWKAWEKEGIIEELALQVYRTQENSFNKNMLAFAGEIDKLEVQNARNHIPTIIGILTGLKPDKRRVSLNLIREQTEATRDRDFAGFAYFFYGSVFDLGFDRDTPQNRKIAFDKLLSTDQFV